MRREFVSEVLPDVVSRTPGDGVRRRQLDEVTEARSRRSGLLERSRNGRGGGGGDRRAATGGGRARRSRLGGDLDLRFFSKGRRLP